MCGDGTIVDMKGQRSNIFWSECKIHDKVCKLIIDGGSVTNAISSDLVHALSLSTWRLPTPRYMQWMNQCGTLKITHRARVKFSVGNYMDTVDCDVVPMNACHMLLGRPWQLDVDATHGGRSNHYSFVHKGVHHVLKPMSDTAINTDIFATSKVKIKATEFSPKLKTALFSEGKNDVGVSAPTVTASVTSALSVTASVTGVANTTSSPTQDVPMLTSIVPETSSVDLQADVRKLIFSCGNSEMAKNTTEDGVTIFFSNSH